MLKFSKTALLFIVIFNLIACSSVPTGIDKDVYNEAKEIASIINKNFNNKSHLSDKDVDKVEKYIEFITSEKLIATSEEKFFLIEVYNLYSFYKSYLLHISFEEKENIEMYKEKYNESLNKLKNEYKVNF